MLLRKPVFVEIFRLLVVVIATPAGYEFAGGDAEGAHAVTGVMVGAAVGYVLGGLAGRRLLTAMGSMEDKIAHTPGGVLLSGSFGALLVGMLAALVSVSAVGLLPGRWGWPIFGVLVWVGVYAGFRVGCRKSEELLAMAGLSARPSASMSRLLGGATNGDPFLVDSSVILDGRLLPLARSGFLPRDLLVPRFVLAEVQGIADSPEPIRRRRARRGLETLTLLQRDQILRVHVSEEELPEIESVDAKLVALASRLSARLLTSDQPLVNVAEVQGVRCLNLKRLANILRPLLAPGDVVQVRISRKGREPGEAIGLLDDGSKIVVANAQGLVGKDADICIRSTALTLAGRTFFASLADADLSSMRPAAASSPSGPAD